MKCAESYMCTAHTRQKQQVNYCSGNFGQKMEDYLCWCARSNIISKCFASLIKFSYTSYLNEFLIPRAHCLILHQDDIIRLLYIASHIRFCSSLCAKHRRQKLKLVADFTAASASLFYISAASYSNIIWLTTTKMIINYYNKRFI